MAIFSASTIPAILKAWMTVEVMSPSLLGKGDVDDDRIILSQEDPTPWLRPAHGQREGEKAVFWMLYLGVIDLSKAQKVILDAFPNEENDELKPAKGLSPLAILVVDGNGVPVDGRLTLSSFAWGLGQLRDDKIDELSDFPQAEAVILEYLGSLLASRDDNGHSEPLTEGRIDAAVTWLIGKLNAGRDVVSPDWRVRRISVRSDSFVPEPDILNSFFVEEIDTVLRAWRAGNLGRALEAYLSGQPEKTRQDVVRTPSLLQSLLEPKRFPLARWTGHGRHPLTLMQQAAVNHAIVDLKEGGLLAVNGPPGTGKTTLLRDMIASVAFDRALALSEYDDPEEAFTYKPFQVSETFKEHRYLLQSELLGFEIVVASVNNFAVENISREIPGISAIADDIDPPLRYFADIADELLAADELPHERAAVKGKSWGLVAAVTGNARKRTQLADIFWAGHFKDYLKHASSRAAEPGVGASSEAQSPHDVALDNWQTARKVFKEKVAKVTGLIKTLDRALDCSEELARVDAEYEKLQTAHIGNGKLLEKYEAERLEKKQKVKEIEATLEEMSADRAVVLALKPGFLGRLFQKKKYQIWLKKLTLLQDQLVLRRKTEAKFKQRIKAIAHNVEKIRKHELLLERQYEVIQKRVIQHRKVIDNAEARGLVVHSSTFWNQPNEQLQKSAPFSCLPLDTARDDLFAATFRLHQAFIEAAAKPVRHNLAALFRGGLGQLKNADSDMMQSLWATLFLVVPVLSTTFASFGRQFAGLGREQIGWLMIDEAGQAAPQEALGAIWRSKRALVVGDPSQIEPVTSLPHDLTRAIFDHFKVSHAGWAAPEISAQSLADRSSWVGTSLERDNQTNWVGMPLRVHRRCDEPMFSVSNNVAYEGLMVSATPDVQSSVGKICGESAWIDIKDVAPGKWSPLEGLAIIGMLRELIETEAEPDVFIITPFREVRAKMLLLIKESFPDDVQKWLRRRVGTVHTFQGKEAEAVFFVLGANGAHCRGARHWAGSKVNLMNVAVTRAKRRLYVIGSYQAWSDVPHFADLAKALKRKDSYLK